MTSLWHALMVAWLIAIGSHTSAFAENSGTAALVDEGQRLAALLRAGRSVISDSQDLINDPSKGDKGLTPETFLSAVAKRYQESSGVMPLEPGLSAEQLRLTEAQLASMAEVLEENLDLINTEGLGFKGFIPAIFARLVNERFGEKLGNAARIKVTAPLDLVRNRKARPDAWEAAVLEGKFKKGDWPKGEAYFEEIADGDTTIFRMLIPEYYGESCLSCHGSPKGEVDVTGFPKEGGAAGDLAGAISITLKR